MKRSKTQYMIELIFALIGSIVFSLASFGMQAFALFHQANVQTSTSECQVLSVSTENTDKYDILFEAQALVQADENKPNVTDGLSDIPFVSSALIVASPIYTHRFAPGSLF